MTLWWLVLAGGVVASTEQAPKLEIDAPHVITIRAGLSAQGARKRVELTARLAGDLEDPQAYYCLDEEWDWDDGAVSFQEPDCDPYEPGAELKREWHESHYFAHGQYVVTFSLMDGDEVIAKAVHEIRVYGAALVRD